MVSLQETIRANKHNYNVFRYTDNVCDSSLIEAYSKHHGMIVGTTIYPSMVVSLMEASAIVRDIIINDLEGDYNHDDVTDREHINELYYETFPMSEAACYLKFINEHMINCAWFNTTQPDQHAEEVVNLIQNKSRTHDDDGNFVYINWS